MPPRIPTLQDFTSILPTHPTSPSTSDPPITLIHPNPPESTTTLLLLFHGLGDTHHPFASFARNLALPGVLAIAVRGTAPLPGLFAPGTDTDTDTGAGAGASNNNNPATQPQTQPQTQQGYHWGDDVTFNRAGDVDADPGFERARAWVMERLVGEVIVGKCGWEVGDVLLFGFGQGGSFALGLASALRRVPRVVEVGEQQDRGGGGAGKAAAAAFKGVVSIGGGLPMSMVPSVSGLGRVKTPVLVCCGRESEAVDEDAVDLLEREFEEVKVVRWKRADDGMPRNREEALPMMQFFADRLRNVWL